MILNQPIPNHCCCGNTSGNINAHTHATLVQICFAATRLSRKPEHGHDGHAIVDDETDIRNTLHGIGLKRFVNSDAFLKKSDIRSVKQGKISVQNVVGVTDQVEKTIGFTTPHPATVFATTEYDQDTLSPIAEIGFEHKTFRQHVPVKIFDPFSAAHDAIYLWNWDVVFFQ